MIQIAGISSAPLRTTAKEKVFVIRVQMLDGRENFFVGFIENGATEYLIVEKNGEPELKPGSYKVPNRHSIESFDISRNGDEYFMETLRTA